LLVLIVLLMVLLRVLWWWWWQWWLLLVIMMIVIVLRLVMVWLDMLRYKAWGKIPEWYVNGTQRTLSLGLNGRRLTTRW
jgi:hypothetical protein